jgi:hypothetical protein
MRVLALHDGHGNLEALVSAPASAPHASVSTGAALSLTEIPKFDVPIDLTKPEQPENLTRLLGQYRLQVKTEARLMKKG